MNWRGLVLLGLVALAAVETAHAKSSRNLRGFVMSSYQGSAPTTSQSDPWAGWPDNDEEDDCYKPKPCTPSPKPCIPSPKPCTPSPTCNPTPRPCDSPMPQPSPVQPKPSPVAQVSPRPSSPCKVDDWKCNNCYMYAKGDMDIFSRCYDCYTSPNQKDDSCAQCTWTYVNDKPTCYKCLADVKAGCPYWTWDTCKQKSKGDDKYMTSCVNCILGTQQKRAVKDDYSGCTMCADACSDATKMGSCSACWLAGGNNYYCSKCQTSAMGADQCYSCLTSKGPFTWDCVK